MEQNLRCFCLPREKKAQNEPAPPDQDSKEVALESKSGPQADYKPVKAASAPADAADAPPAAADAADAPAAENAPVESISEEVTAKLEEFAIGGSYGMGDERALLPHFSDVDLTMEVCD